MTGADGANAPTNRTRASRGADRHGPTTGCSRRLTTGNGSSASSNTPSRIHLATTATTVSLDRVRAARPTTGGKRQVTHHPHAHAPRAPSPRAPPHRYERSLGGYRNLTYATSSPHAPAVRPTRPYRARPRTAQTRRLLGTTNGDDASRRKRPRKRASRRPYRPPAKTTAHDDRRHS